MFIPRLKINLQYFSADIDKGGGAYNSSDESNDEVKNDTQDIDQDEIKSQVTKELLESLGVSSIEDVKTTLESWREYQEGQKTELQKAQDSISLKDNAIAEKDNIIEDLNARLSATQLGVPSENVKDVITLAKATGEKDVSKAIEIILDKYPHFKGGVEDDIVKPTFITQNQPKQPTNEDAFRKALGLK